MSITCGIHSTGAVTMAVEVLRSTCNMCICDLPDMYALGPVALGLWRLWACYNHYISHYVGRSEHDNLNLDVQYITSGFFPLQVTVNRESSTVLKFYNFNPMNMFMGIVLDALARSTNMY